MTGFPKPKKMDKCKRCGDRYNTIHPPARCAYVQAVKRKNKYSAERVSHAGYSFASKLEVSIFNILNLRLKAGEINSIKTQVHIHLTDARILYIADFAALDIASGKEFYIEAKGMETDSWRIKLRLWRFYGPGRLEIWRGDWKNPKLSEVVIPGLYK